MREWEWHLRTSPQYNAIFYINTTRCILHGNKTIYNLFNYNTRQVSDLRANKITEMDSVDGVGVHLSHSQAY